MPLSGTGDAVLAAPVPALNRWGLGLLAVLFGVLSMRRLVRLRETSPPAPSAR